MKAQTNTQSYGAPECFVQNYWNLVTVRPNHDKKTDLEFKLNVLLCTFKACLGTYSFNKIYRWRSEEAAFLVLWQGTQQATAGVVACPTLLDLIKANPPHHHQQQQMDDSFAFKGRRKRGKSGEVKKVLKQENGIRRRGLKERFYWIGKSRKYEIRHFKRQKMYHANLQE